jgi:hypothetical protein
MRCSAVRTAIETAIEAITPDAPTHLPFRLLDARGREVGQVTERVFTVELGAVPRRDVAMMTVDAWLANYDIAVYYAPGDTVEDRIASDFERIQTVLLSLHEQDNDIYASNVTPGVVQRIEGALAASVNVDITYRLTGI